MVTGEGAVRLRQERASCRGFGGGGATAEIGAAANGICVRGVGRGAAECAPRPSRTSIPPPPPILPPFHLLPKQLQALFEPHSSRFDFWVTQTVGWERSGGVLPSASCCEANWSSRKQGGFAKPLFNFSCQTLNASHSSHPCPFLDDTFIRKARPFRTTGLWVFHSMISGFVGFFGKSYFPF